MKHLKCFNYFQHSFLFVFSTTVCSIAHNFSILFYYYFLLFPVISHKGFLKIQIKFGVRAICGASNQQCETFHISDLATNVNDFLEHTISSGE